VLFFIARNQAAAPDASRPIVPVDLVRLGDQTQSPAEDMKALMPQQKASAPREAASPTRETVAPNATKPAPPDALDAKLRALARLRQPPSDVKIALGQGVSNLDASSGAPGDEALYSVKDYVLAQVLRRWNLNLAKSAGRDFVIAIRVAMKRDGTILSADIVEEKRAKADVVYRDIALSARNAVILSSPIAMPPGEYAPVMRFTLDLSPRATQR